MKKIASLFFTALLFSTILFGQDSLRREALSIQDPIQPAKKLFLNFSGHYGFIIPHHYNMQYLIKEHVRAAEIDFIIQTAGEKRWEQVYKNPEKGIGLFFAYLGNPDQLGNAIGIFPFINFPLNPGRKFKLYIRSSDGIGLITKPYDRVNNHKNNVNGTRINAFINLRLNSVFYPAKNLRMEAGIGMSHLSNGSFSRPNLGINIATIHMGISAVNRRLHLPDNSRTSSFVSADTTQNEKYFFTVTPTAGPCESGRPDGDKYTTFSLQSSAWKTISEKSRIYTGVDLFYSYANLYNAVHDTVFDTTNPLSNLQAGVRIGYELVIGRISLPVEAGAYFFTKTLIYGQLYHRIGIRYRVTKRIIINYSLKTHWATAENLEFGIGYRF